jgi:glycosyltransferase involved in cell wall biosynthesis
VFSVVIASYNKKEYIQKAIQSVLNQKYVDFEIIIIDDGSCDNTIQEIECFKYRTDFRIKIVEQSNLGVSTARNNGITFALFDYIAFLDADDWWTQDYLQEMKTLIEKYPQAGIYGSSYFNVKNNQLFPAKIGVQKGFSDGLINYFKVYAKTLWMPLWTGSTVIKKSVFDEVGGFNTKLKLGEDFDLWTRVAIKYPVAFLNIPLAYYNQDVDVNTRAVGIKLYEPHEHMLFTDYDQALMANKDFVFLRERLLLYGLLPYFAAEKNLDKVKLMINTIQWKKHELKYFIFYMIFTPAILRRWRQFFEWGSALKRKLPK